ncbi:MAG: lipopolysaccharide biosynthesis protein, partial [Acidimicrobiia bacterium]
MTASAVAPRDQFTRAFAGSFALRLATAFIGLVASFTITGLAARHLSDRDLTAFLVILTSLMIGPMVMRLGTGSEGVRAIAVAMAEGDTTAARRAATANVSQCLTVGVLAAPLVTALVLLSADTALSPLLAVTVAATLVAESVRLAAGDVLLGLGVERAAIAAGHQVRAAVVCVALAVYLTAGGAATLMALSALLAAVTLLLAVVALMVVRRHGGPYALRGLLPRWAALRAGLPFLALESAAFAMHRGDLWLAARFLPDHEAALYATASMLAHQLALPAGLANVALAPMVAAAHASGRYESLQRNIRRAALGVVALTAAPLLVFLAATGPLLALAFGPGFRDAAPFVLILMAGNLVLAMVSTAPVVLSMTGRAGDAARQAWLSLLVTAPLAVAAVQFGGRQLAVASAFMT